MTSRFIRLLPTAYLVALDVAAAAAVTMLYLHFAQISTTPLWLGYPLAFLVGAPLAVRRKWPLPVLAVVLTAQNAATVLDITLEMYTPSAFALYLVGVEVPRRRSVAALAAAVATAAVALLIGQPWPDGLGLSLAVALVLASAWALGRTLRVRRAYTARTAAEEASRAVAQERLRIARELHDVVAHSLSVIAVKAGVANHVDDAAVAREALGVIERASRGTLVEMRRLLGVLRDEGGTAELAPVPGLADLPDLASTAALAGVEVRLRVSGEQVPDGVGLAVYRIVQESVTNVVKHAAPARCEVTVAVGEEAVRVEVTDDGPGVRSLPGPVGHGLAGMRERVALYGGTLTTGPAGTGGFRVLAEVPLT